MGLCVNTLSEEGHLGWDHFPLQGFHSTGWAFAWLCHFIVAETPSPAVLPCATASGQPTPEFILTSDTLSAWLVSDLGGGKEGTEGSKKGGKEWRKQRIRSYPSGALGCQYFPQEARGVLSQTWRVWVRGFRYHKGEEEKRFQIVQNRVLQTEVVARFFRVLWKGWRRSDESPFPQARRSCC